MWVFYWQRVLTRCCSCSSRKGVLIFPRGGITLLYGVAVLFKGVVLIFSIVRLCGRLLITLLAAADAHEHTTACCSQRQDEGDAEECQAEVRVGKRGAREGVSWKMTV